MINFNEMGKVELRAACKEAGIKNYGKMTNALMREALEAHYADAEVKQVESVQVETEVEQVAPATESASVAETAQEVVEAAPAGKGIKIEKDREERNGVKRPSIGGVCREVWDYLDRIVAEGAVPTVGLVKLRAEKEGWNLNNASIEFYQWRKFHGIRGRQPKA